MKSYEELYNALIDELKHTREGAQEIYDDYKAAGLTFNTIEAEGYVRGTLECFNLVKYIEDMFKE